MFKQNFNEKIQTDSNKKRFSVNIRGVFARYKGKYMGKLKNDHFDTTTYEMKHGGFCKLYERGNISKQYK